MDNRPTTAKPTRLAPQRVRIDGAGRIVVPADMRRALEIRDGEELTISLEDDGLRLRTLAVALARVQAIARRRRRDEGSVVDAFLAERHAEAAGD